jgi:Domain of unknown function (DUF4384)
MDRVSALIGILACLQGCAAAAADSAPGELIGTSARTPLQLALAATVVPAPPLYLEVWATVRGTAVGLFHPGVALHSGDTIGLQARTSIAAHVYLMHCDRNAVLSVFPTSGPIDFRADQRVSLPAAGMDIRLSGAPGNETLYVVASRHPLDRSDPVLQATLSRTSTHGDEPVCGEQLEGLLAGSSPTGRAHARERTPRARQRAALRGIELSDGSYSVARAFAVEDGVIVLRFPFHHLP